jgi:hypothetical protein
MTDFFAGTTKWQRQVTEILLRDEPQHSDSQNPVTYVLHVVSIDISRPALMYPHLLPYSDWAIGAAWAYKAYKDPKLLAVAEQLWNKVIPYMVTEAQAQTGQHPVRNVPLQKTCRGRESFGFSSYRSVAALPYAAQSSNWLT